MTWLRRSLFTLCSLLLLGFSMSASASLIRVPVATFALSAAASSSVSFRYLLVPRLVGIVVTQTDANGITTTRVVTLANHNSQHRSHTVVAHTDATGLLISRTDDASGVNATSHYTYGAQGLRTQVVINGTQTSHMAYDNAGNLTQLTNKAGQVGSYTRQYGYDAYSRLLNTQWPNGTTSHWQYNLAGYPSGVEDAQQQWLYGITAQDAWNRPTDISLAAGAIQQTATSATNSGRPLSVVTQATSTALQHATWQWWSNGSMAERTTLTAGGNRTDAFSYDGLERLTEATASGATTATDSASYTTSGNIATKTGITGQYSYSSSQPYAVISAGGTNYSYDAAGNMTQRGNTNITYNAIGQPLSFYQAANELTRFAYDSDYARYYQWAKLANGDTQETFYIGASYEEKVTHQAGRHPHRAIRLCERCCATSHRCQRHANHRNPLLTTQCAALG